MLEPKVLDFVREDGPSDFGFEVLPRIIAHGLPVYGYRMHEDLWWVDTPESYAQVRSLGESGDLRLV
jgi:NDP-sugar pyrophosphorylase family protein